MNSKCGLYSSRSKYAILRHVFLGFTESLSSLINYYELLFVSISTLCSAIDPSTVEVVESPRDDSKSPLTPRTKGEVNRSVSNFAN